MEKHQPAISGHLDIFVADHEDEFEGKKVRWQDVLIHGDPEGLRSFAQLLIRLADLNQDTIETLPVEAREHIHLRSGFDISKSSAEVIVGRMDAKGTGAFYDRYIEKEL